MQYACPPASVMKQQQTFCQHPCRCPSALPHVCITPPPPAVHPPMPMQAVLGQATPARFVGFACVFLAASAVNVWLSYITYQQFGWRVHSKLACDYRRKHATKKQQLYFLVSRQAATAAAAPCALGYLHGGCDTSEDTGYSPHTACSRKVGGIMNSNGIGMWSVYC